MYNLQTIREKVLQKIRPTQEHVERAHRSFSRIQAAVERVAEQQKLEIAFIELEGSTGRKQTQLRDHRDLDVFIGLPISLLPEILGAQPPEKAALRRLLKKIVKEVAVKAASLANCQNISIAFAEHPYVTATLDDFRVDLVFCFNLPKEYILERGPITAVDRTPHHSRFVDEHLSNEQRDDVRLLKAFFQTCFVYGDASPVGRSGFTGFSAEMLVYHNQAIGNALQGLKSLHTKPLDYFGRPTEELKQRFSNDLLIMVDPTDPQRNLAASISGRAYRYACHQTDQLLIRPAQHFFLPKAIPVLPPLEEKHLEPNHFVIEYKDDTGWHYTKTRDKLYRYFTRLCRFLRREPTGESRFGLTIFEEVFEGKLYAIALRVTHFNISTTYLRIGPPHHLDAAVRQFREKHPNARLHNGCYQAKIERPFTRAEDAIRHYLTHHSLSPNLHQIGFTHKGMTKIGKQSLWILKKAVLPFLEQEHQSK